MSDQIRRIAVIGGSRIPFCRSNSIFRKRPTWICSLQRSRESVDRFGLDGMQLDEVVAGAVTTHAKDWNLAREALLSTRLSPLTPGITLQQACGTSLQSAMMIGAKIASGQIECGIAAGTDTTSDPPISFRPQVFTTPGQGGRRPHRQTAFTRLQGLQAVRIETRPAGQW